MRVLSFIIIFLSLSACTSFSKVLESQPTDARYVHVVLDQAIAANRSTRNAFISGIWITNERSVFPKETKAQVDSVPVLTNFYIRPGRYTIGYSCVGVQTDIYFKKTVTFKLNKSYTLHCTVESAELIIVST